ncbi:MAG: deoxyribodipyrimidine photo-lyase [Cocleimonas sp.]|jgi:deoxyribodipyrimidine photo-lyase
MKRAIVWLRQDLRLSDNTALHNACNECDEVIPVFIDDSVDEEMSQSASALGSASRVWLHHSLISLNNDLQEQHSTLILKQGKALEVLQSLIEETKATHVYWNRCYEPEVIKRDELIKSTLKKSINVQSFKGSLLLEPWEGLKQDGTPYRVFTPYWKAMTKDLVITKPLPIPVDFKAPKNWSSSIDLDELDLLPSTPIPNWDEDMMSYWKVGESAAHDNFQAFLEDGVANYKERRDFPAIGGTSLLSPQLHFGEISPLQLFYIARDFETQNAQPENYSHPSPLVGNGIGHILRQLVWREFSHSLLYHFPQTVTEPLYEKYAPFKWRNSPEDLQRWQQGMTGFPIIDAGMRQLYATGYMHNRVRMITSSFLCKNLLIHWREGEAWFRDTLVDADLGNNTMGWQWVAGCGADAAPYYRIFNPLLQSEKFDKEGTYIRRWVPELSELTNKQIHQPTMELAERCDYPSAMVDLKATRLRALDRFADLKKSFS